MLAGLRKAGFDQCEMYGVNKQVKCVVKGTADLVRMPSIEFMLEKKDFEARFVSLVDVCDEVGREDEGVSREWLECTFHVTGGDDLDYILLGPKFFFDNYIVFDKTNQRVGIQRKAEETMEEMITQKTSELLSRIHPTAGSLFGAASRMHDISRMYSITMVSSIICMALYLFIMFTSSYYKL